MNALERDGYRCQLHYPGCRVLASEVDHITPGDNHSPGNLQSVCTPCHLRKSGREGNEARNRR